MCLDFHPWFCRVILDRRCHRKHTRHTHNVLRIFFFFVHRFRNLLDKCPGKFAHMGCFTDMSMPMTMKHLLELPHINTITYHVYSILANRFFFVYLKQCFLVFAFLRLFFFLCSFSFRGVFVGWYYSYVICFCWYDITFVLIFLGIVLYLHTNITESQQMKLNMVSNRRFLFIWFIGFTVFVPVLFSSVACLPTEWFLLVVYSVYWTYTNFFRFY